MTVTTVLLCISVVLRGVGTILRTNSRWWFVRTAGWVCCTVAVWTAVSAAGAWSSIMPALLIAAAGAIIETRMNRRLVWVSADVATVLLVGLLSLPPLGWQPVIGVSLAIAAVGFGIDWLALQFSERVRTYALALPVILVGVALLVRPGSAASAARLLEYRILSPALTLPYSAIVPRTQERPVEQVSATPPDGPSGAQTSDAPAAAGSPSRELALPLIANAIRTGTQWEPYVEWSLDNPTYSGNPYDVVASVTFTHEASAETRTTGMFYAGDTTWKFRFTGTRTGIWNFVTQSDDPDLHGLTGAVQITPNTQANLPGFITPIGDKWVQSGTNRAFVPRFLMYSDPIYFYANPSGIDADIQTFIGEHGFNGFHVQVYCRWFDLESKECGSINQADPNPDPRTFEALELLITRTHAAGGVVHLWMWGDDERGWNPKRWGLNGPQDQRLQRYIAARLGPLPGWSMGYGFDLYEWVEGSELETWYNYLYPRLGWSHPLGARAEKNQLTQLTEVLDYASYEQVRPDYDAFVAAITARPHKPTFSEDRFRILSNTSSERHFSPDQIRRMLWQTAMAGGVAAIWGNLGDGRESAEGSAPFPNAAQLKTMATFIDPRFTPDLVRCPSLTDGTCLQRPTQAHYLFYKEDAASIRMNLSSMAGAQRAVAVDTRKPYKEIDLGLLSPADQTWTAPYVSDWAIAAGDF